MDEYKIWIINNHPDFIDAIQFRINLGLNLNQIQSELGHNEKWAAYEDECYFRESESTHVNRGLTERFIRKYYDLKHNHLRKIPSFSGFLVGLGFTENAANKHAQTIQELRPQLVPKEYIFAIRLYVEDLDVRRNAPDSQFWRENYPFIDWNSDLISLGLSRENPFLNYLNLGIDKNALGSNPC